MLLITAPGPKVHTWAVPGRRDAPHRPLLPRPLPRAVSPQVLASLAGSPVPREDSVPPIPLGWLRCWLPGCWLRGLHLTHHESDPGERAEARAGAKGDCGRRQSFRLAVPTPWGSFSIHSSGTQRWAGAINGFPQ